MTVLGIIQARMNSTRLPGKVLSPLHGRPMIAHVVERCAAASHIDAIVLATTREASDDALADFATKNLGIAVYRGETDDVLARFYHAASPHRPDIIVRITADDPLKDGAIIDRAVQHLLDDPALDYCSNTLCPTFPEGLDIEAFRFAALEAAHHAARLPSEREHVTPYIWNRPDAFRLHNFTHDEDLSHWRLTVDKPQDMELMAAIFDRLGKTSNLFGYREIIALLKREPQLLAINAGTVRNEGYLKSLAGERP